MDKIQIDCVGTIFLNLDIKTQRAVWTMIKLARDENKTKFLELVNLIKTVESMTDGEYNSLLKGIEIPLAIDSALRR
jgi:predicted nucleic acid-binding protein